jgi:hypothetical protein
MPQEIISDFSAGWIPSDHPLNARRNGFLRMENVALEPNNSVSMAGGTTRLLSAFSNNLHSSLAVFMSSQQVHYSGDTAGNIFRNATNIGSSGSTTRCGLLGVWDFVLLMSGAARKRDDGTTATVLGQVAASTPTVATDGAGNISGDLEYIQINVYSNGGSYRSKSAPSPVATVTAVDNKILVTPHNPTSPANEVWIFRRGGALAQFYRVLRITSSYTTPVDDNTSDQDALDDGVTANLNALSVNSTDLPDSILEIVGPVNQRVLYFSATTVHFSETNSPESYVPGQSEYFMGAAATAEIFCWAKKVGNNIVLIGTTHDVYRLTGSMIEMPDGTLDNTIRGLGVSSPPLGRDCDVHGGGVVYMSAQGWVICDINGNLLPLCPPNVDTLYSQHNDAFTVGRVPILNSLRYSCVVAGNKLYGRVPEEVNDSSNPATFIYRIDVYDFVRQYWTSVRYDSNNAPDYLIRRDDDIVVGFFSNDKYLKVVNSFIQKTIDEGSSVNQTVKLLTPFYSLGGDFKRRHDISAFKLRISTGGGDLTYSIYTDGNQTSVVKTGTINSNGVSIVSIPWLDGSGNPLAAIKSYQFLFSSSTLPDFQLIEIAVSFESRPEQLTYLRIPGINFDSLARKRFQSIGALMDTLGNDVLVNYRSDGGVGTFATVNSSYAKTHIFYMPGNLIHDFELLLSGGPFEFYKLLPPQDKVFVEPEPAENYFSPTTNFGIYSKKRIRVIALSLDTNNDAVTFTPVVDGVTLTTATFNSGTNGKKTFFYFFKTDIFGVDFSYSLVSGTPFYFYGELNPEIVQSLMIPKQFDQLGPEEFFKYGKVRALRVRLLSDSTASIPYTVYFQDQTKVTGNISAIANVEDVYEISFPKTTAGTIMRIELGPTAFNFYRYYAEVQVTKSGKDTENQWILMPETLPQQMGGPVNG